MKGLINDPVVTPLFLTDVLENYPVFKFSVSSLSCTIVVVKNVNPIWEWAYNEDSSHDERERFNNKKFLSKRVLFHSTSSPSQNQFLEFQETSQIKRSLPKSILTPQSSRKQLSICRNLIKQSQHTKCLLLRECNTLGKPFLELSSRARLFSLSPDFILPTSLSHTILVHLASSSS